MFVRAQCKIVNGHTGFIVFLPMKTLVNFPAHSLGTLPSLLAKLVSVFHPVMDALGIRLGLRSCDNAGNILSKHAPHQEEQEIPKSADANDRVRQNENPDKPNPAPACCG